MVGTTGRVVRTVVVQDVKQRGGQAFADGEHEEKVEDACVVLAELPDGKLRVLAFASNEQRELDAKEFTPVGAG